MTSTAALVLSLVLASQTTADAKKPTIDIKGKVTLIREVQVPARQPGLLREVAVQEGQSVQKEQLLAQLDDSDALLRRIAAEREYLAAAEQAKDNVEEQAAKAAALVAEAELDDSRYVNDRSPGAINPTELRRQELTAERANLQIKVAMMEFEVAKLTSSAAQAKVDVIQHEVDTRKILSDFDGLVVAQYRQAGEWVQAGDPVFKVIQMDRLRVQGFVLAGDYAPHEIEGRPAKITIKLPGGKAHEIAGTVGYCSQVVESSREHRLWVEIENVPVAERNGHIFWMIAPGMDAAISIDMSDVAATRMAKQ